MSGPNPYAAPDAEQPSTVPGPLSEVQHQRPNPPGAVAALVLGIIAAALNLFCYFGIISLILGVLAIIFAAKAKRRYLVESELYTGLGLAKAGSICGLIGAILGVLTSIGIGLMFWFIFSSASRIERDLRLERMPSSATAPDVRTRELERPEATPRRQRSSDPE